MVKSDFVLELDLSEFVHQQSALLQNTVCSTHDVPECLGVLQTCAEEYLKHNNVDSDGVCSLGTHSLPVTGKRGIIC